MFVLLFHLCNGGVFFLHDAQRQDLVTPNEELCGTRNARGVHGEGGCEDLKQPLYIMYNNIHIQSFIHSWNIILILKYNEYRSYLVS